MTRARQHSGGTAQPNAQYYVCTDKRSLRGILPIAVRVDQERGADQHQGANDGGACDGGKRNRTAREIITERRAEPGPRPRPSRSAAASLALLPCHDDAGRCGRTDQHVVDAIQIAGRRIFVVHHADLRRSLAPAIRAGCSSYTAVQTVWRARDDVALRGDVSGGVCTRAYGVPPVGGVHLPAVGWCPRMRPIRHQCMRRRRERE